MKDTTITKISGIYKIINKINGKYYVGSSNNILGKKGRWYKHKNSLDKNKHPNDYLQNSWNKHGENNFEFLIIEEIESTKQKLLKIEQKYLSIAKNEQDKCYNLNFEASGGELSEYSKIKISQKIKGNEKLKSFLGKHHTEEHKKKMSMLMSGKNNHRYGKPGTNLGRKWSFKTKLKMSNPTIYTFMNIKTNEKFTGTPYQLRMKYNDLNPSTILSVVKGKRRMHHNWKMA